MIHTGIHYSFYNPNNGVYITGAKYVGMPFFNDNVPTYGIKRCAIEENYKTNTITNWTIDENSSLFQFYYCYGNNYWTDYISRECALKMQQDMTINKTLFTDMMDENNCDALIMDVSY